MKKVFLLFLCLNAIYSFAQNVNIPDPIFKDYLLNDLDINTNGDDEIDIAEAESYFDVIQVDSMGISDMTGIEAFNNIYNLTCSHNNITSIDVTQNTRLTTIDIRDNQLTELDLSSNLNLGRLFATDNFLTELDVTNNLELWVLTCHNNQLPELDISNNTKLELLYCNENNLSDIDVSNNNLLTQIACSYNNISEIDVSQNPLLINLGFTGNTVSTIDVSYCPLLEILHAGENQLVDISVSNNPNLKYLIIEDNFITEIDLTSCEALYSIQANNNLLKNMDASNSPILERVWIENNQLEALDFTANPIFNNLYCRENKLEYLNVANGNNMNFNTMWARDNPDLFCIIVDEDLDIENLNDRWQKDKQAEYNGSCCVATNSEINESICEGEILTSPSGILITEAGNYTDMISNVGGCDSLITINVEIATVNSEVSQEGNVLTAIASDATFQWIDCDNDNVAIEGATNQIFIPETNGSYAVLVGENGCLDVSNCYEVMTVGTEDFISNNIKVFPNPTTDFIRFDLGESYQNVELLLWNTNGQLLRRQYFQNESLIDFEFKNESNGVYVFEIKYDDQTLSRTKVIKF